MCLYCSDRDEVGLTSHPCVASLEQQVEADMELLEYIYDLKEQYSKTEIHKTTFMKNNESKIFSVLWFG